MSKEIRSVEINLDGSGFRKLECIVEVKRDELSSITKVIAERTIVKVCLKAQKRRNPQATLIRQKVGKILGLLLNFFSSIAAGLLVKSWWK